MSPKLSLMAGLSFLAIAGLSGNAHAGTAPTIIGGELINQCGAEINPHQTTYACRDGSTITVRMDGNTITASRPRTAPVGHELTSTSEDNAGAQPPAFVAPQSGTTQTASYQPPPTSSAWHPTKPPAPPGMDPDRFKCGYNPNWAYQRCSTDTLWNGTSWDFRPGAQFTYFDFDGKYIGTNSPRLENGRWIVDNTPSSAAPTQQVASNQPPPGSVRGMMQGKPSIESLNVHGPDGDYHAVAVAQPSAGDRLLDAGIGVGLLFALGEASHRARCYNHC